MASLILFISGQRQRDVPLDGGRMRLGRSEECEVQVDEAGVSRTHAVVFRAGERFVIEDLGSRNGTYVNGVRVERHALAPGDRIRLAPTAELGFEDDRTRPRGNEDARRTEEGRPREGRRRSGFLNVESIRLVPQEEGRRERPFAVRGTTTVGREDAAAVALEDASVSKLHARLDRGPDGLYVTDLKSKNGTRVNGAPILRARLQNGDVVQFGNAGFRVVMREEIAWVRLGKILAGAVVLVLAGIGVAQWAERASENAAVRRERERVRRQAVTSVEKGIAAFRSGDVDFARSYLSYAADVLLLADLAPQEASLREPNEVFRGIVRDLPPEARSFDFAKVFDTSQADIEKQNEIDRMPTKEFVEYQCRLIAVELGQSRDVPAGFIDQVMGSVEHLSSYGGYQVTLNRSHDLHRRLRDLLHEASLPEIFCYVAWVESGLSPNARSQVGAVGLWQFMPETARAYGLRVDPASGVDERTDVTKSTRAAAGYIGNLIRKFGREQFMCALASYNRGENGVWNAMEKIPDPMMESSQKFWYLVQNGLLPRETSDYVPRIFAAKILADAPERFGFHE